MDIAAKEVEEAIILSIVQSRLRKQNKIGKNPDFYGKITPEKPLSGTEDINIIISIFNEKSQEHENINLNDVDDPALISEVLLTIASNKNFDPKSLFTDGKEIDPSIRAFARTISKHPEKLAKAQRQSAEWNRRKRAMMTDEEKKEHRAKDAKRKREARALQKTQQVTLK